MSHHYFTTYTHHIEEGETALMLMTDFTTPSAPKRDEGQGDYLSQMLMLEYGISDQIEIEPMIEWFQDVETGAGKFTGFRLEGRYRLFEDEVPLNPTLYAEYEDLDPETRFKMEVSGWVLPPYTEKEEEITREKIQESRLILSQDFGRFNIAANWLNESDLHTGRTAFGYMFGASYRLEGDGHVDHGEHADHAPAPLRPSSLGVEFVGALGDSRHFALRPARQEHYLQPSLNFHLGDHTMLNLGFALGLSRASDDMIRLSVMWEF